jgi:hypothetical protein
LMLRASRDLGRWARHSRNTLHSMNQTTTNEIHHYRFDKNL